MLFTDTMTVYNHTKENGVDVWTRHIIKGVQWSHSKLETLAGDVQNQTRVESITVDFERKYGNPTYVTPKDFESTSDKTNIWTLNAKNKQDIVVFGAVSNDITSTYKISDLRADNQYIGTVTSVSDNRNRAHLRTIKVVVK